MLLKVLQCDKYAGFKPRLAEKGPQAWPRVHGSWDANPRPSSISAYFTMVPDPRRSISKAVARPRHRVDTQVQRGNHTVANMVSGAANLTPHHTCHLCSAPHTREHATGVGVTMAVLYGAFDRLLHNPQYGAEHSMQCYVRNITSAFKKQPYGIDPCTTNPNMPTLYYPPPNAPNELQNGLVKRQPARQRRHRLRHRHQRRHRH